MQDIIYMHGPCRDKNKHWELQAYFSKMYFGEQRYAATLFENGHPYVWKTEINLGPFFNAGFSWTKNKDHAGIEFGFEILWFNFSASCYDVRHWDDYEDCWIEE
jgi:hypothetical protein